MNVPAVLRSAMALAVVLVLHVGLFDGLPLFGRVAEPLLVLAVAGGLVGGPWHGLRLGFAAGLLYDLIAGTPLGLAAFAYALAAFLAGWLADYMVRTWWLVPPLCALGLSLYVGGGELFGQGHLYTSGYGVTVGVVVLWAVVLAVPMLWLARWARRPAASDEPPPRRVLRAVGQ